MLDVFIDPAFNVGLRAHRPEVAESRRLDVPDQRYAPRVDGEHVGEESDVATWRSWFVQAGADVEQVAQLFAGLLQEPTRRLTA